MDATAWLLRIGLWLIGALVVVYLMRIWWDSRQRGWIGTTDDNPVFFWTHLASIRGWEIRVHKFVAADMPGCYHTHPAFAFRLVLWGGYEEHELIESMSNQYMEAVWNDVWTPGRWGFIKPEFCHRIHRLINGPSYSLWIHGPKVAKIELRGTGWPEKILRGRDRKQVEEYR